MLGRSRPERPYSMTRPNIKNQSTSKNYNLFYFKFINLRLVFFFCVRPSGNSTIVCPSVATSRLFGHSLSRVCPGSSKLEQKRRTDLVSTPQWYLRQGSPVPISRYVHHNFAEPAPDPQPGPQPDFKKFKKNFPISKKF